MLTRTLLSTKPQILEFEIYFALLTQNTKRYIFQCKKCLIMCYCHNIYKKQGQWYPIWCQNRYTVQMCPQTLLFLFVHTWNSKSIAWSRKLVVRIFCSMTRGALRNSTCSGFVPQRIEATPHKSRLRLCPDSLLSKPKDNGPRLSTHISMLLFSRVPLYARCSMYFLHVRRLFGQTVVFKPSSGLLLQ